MTDQERAPGIVGAAASVVTRIAETLPPAFLALLLINSLFIGLIFWGLDRQATQRAEVVMRLLDHCLSDRPR